MSAPGVYDWSGFDAIVADARADGVSLLPVLSYAPSWTTPEDASGYASFVAAAVARYGPGTPANLGWFELWNEPYFPYAWSGRTPEPMAYARDVRAAAQAAKQVAPSVKVLIAAENGDTGAAGNQSGWWTTSVDDYFAAVPDLGKWIDGVAVHPYGDDPALGLTQPGGWRDASGGWSFQRIDSIRQSFLNHGVNVPFWITEVGWSSYDVSEATQASDYQHLISQVAQRPWVRALFTFCLREFDDPPTEESQYGLLRYGTWQPKPAFTGLQTGLASLS